MSDKQITSAFDDIESRDSNKIAVLDIGSNSFHLVVARIISGTVQILHKTKIKVRLASGLSKDNVLSAVAINRGIDALQVIKKSLEGFNPNSVRIIATYTLRKAKNAWQFVENAKEVFPYPVEIIAGQEEARLIFNGVCHTLPLQENTLIIDIGGGSTEFAIGKNQQPSLLRSLDMGCVSFSHNYFKNGELKNKYFKKAILAARQQLELIEDKFIAHGWKLAVGTSGTIESICTICGLDGLGYQLKLADLETLQQKLVEFKQIDNIVLPHINEDRIPVLPAGLAILIAIFKSLHIDKLEFNSAALREGVIYDMEDSFSGIDVREHSAQSLATRYDVDTEQANLVLSNCFDFYRQVHKDWKLSNKLHKPLLGWAALLHEIGLHVNSRGVQKHSYYILSNAEMPGFNSEQQEFLSLLTLMHRKKFNIQQLPRFAQFKSSDFVKCAILLRLSYLLNIKRQKQFVPNLKITVNNQVVELQFPKNWLTQHPIISADLQRESERYKKQGYSLIFS